MKIAMITLVPSGLHRLMQDNPSLKDPEFSQICRVPPGMCLSLFLDAPTKYHRLIYKKYAFGLMIQVAVCGKALLLVGLSAKVQDGAGHCSGGQIIPTHIPFLLMKPQYCQIKVSPTASFNLNYFPQNLQIRQLDYVSLLYMLHDRNSVCT